MDFTEQELHDFLGTSPAPSGEETPETAPEPEAEPETAPEVQEPETPEEPETTEPEAKAEEPSAGDLEAEKQAAIQQAVANAVAQERARAAEEWRAFFARAGLKNTVSGKEITSREEFEDWYRAYEAARMERELKEGKLTPETLQRMADRAVAERMRQQAPSAPPKQDVTPEQIQRELAAIHQMDESVSTLEDIRKMDTWDKFQDAVMNRGYSFLDAFRIANFDAIMERKREDASRRAAQAALNNARSKDHLAASRSQGTGAVAVPAGDMELFRAMLPKASEQEITEYYNRYLKETKRGA